MSIGATGNTEYVILGKLHSMVMIVLLSYSTASTRCYHQLF